MKEILTAILHSVNRKLFSTNWKDLRSTKPISELFGTDRGLPVDRYYIESFLRKNRKHITGRVLEIGDNYYSDKFGDSISKQEIFHFTEENTKATIIGDLTNNGSLKPNFVDCFICTQTLNFIYDYKSAIQGIYHMLKPGGVSLITVAGISQISRYDMDRWGDYWRFTVLSLQNSFSEIFGEKNISINSYGNVLSSIAMLEGISSEELKHKELDYHDENYQMLIGIKVIKKISL